LYLGGGNTYINVKAGQSFIATKTDTLKYISVLLSPMDGSCDDVIYAEITDKTWKTLEKVSAKGMINGTGKKWVTFEFSNKIMLQTGQEYRFKVYLEGATHNYAMWASPDVYPDGAMYDARESQGGVFTVKTWDSAFQIAQGQVDLSIPVADQAVSVCPKPVGGEGQFSPIVGGGFHTIALKKDGTVWTWGKNDFGQLGDGTTNNSSTPVKVIGLSGVKVIAGGQSYTIALKEDGTVWAWGLNDKGQLGYGTITNRSTPVQVSGLFGVIKIVTGNYHSIALKADGTVWAWGLNSYVQLRRWDKD